MSLIAIGTRIDVTGFALAGVDGIVCGTAEQVRAALRTVAARPGAAIVLLSAECAAQAGPDIEAFQRRQDLPMLVVLPEPSAGPGTEPRR